MAEQFEKIASWMTLDSFGDIDIPEELHPSLERHHRNLAALVANLRSVGVSDEMIETSVTVLVASYKDELLRSIRSMMR